MTKITKATRDNCKSMKIFFLWLWWLLVHFVSEMMWL